MVVLIVEVVVFCAVLVELWVVVFLFGSAAGSVLVFVGGVGGGEKEAEAAVELEASSSVTVAGGDFEALGAFEEVAFPLPPDLPLAKGPFCLIPLMGQ